MDARNIVETTLVPHTAFETANRKIEQCFKYADQTLEPICIAIIGESRTGKTRNLELCYLNHPSYRIDSGLKVPIIKVKTPSKPTVKGLVELLLRAIGDPKYYVGTENVKTIRLQKLLQHAETKMIMIDEVQHFVDKTSHKIMHHVADWLKVLIDDTRIALVLAGLPNSKDVIQQNEQLAGRFSSPVIMPRFDWRKSSDQDEFIAILNTFYKSISKYFDIPQIYNDEYAYRFYAASGGLMGYLTKLLRQTVWNVLDEGSKQITLVHFDMAFKDAIWTYNTSCITVSPFSKKFSVKSTHKDMNDIMLIGTPPPTPSTKTKSV